MRALGLKAMAELQDELYSLLIPLAEQNLIVPRACVAEVVAYTDPVAGPGEADWYLGDFEWNGNIVPILSFEAACGGPVPEISRRTRVVVFFCIGARLKSGFFGVLTQGFPQLVRVSPGVLETDTTALQSDGSPVLCQVRMVNEKPVIPDLERLEDMLVESVTTEE